MASRRGWPDIWPGRTPSSALLTAGARVVVDNTNPTPDERSPLVAVARRAGVPVRAVWVDTPLPLCLERNEAREGRTRVRLPGILGTRRRFVPPDRAEGFDRVDVVRGDR